MDPRTVISYSLLLCVIGDIGVRSSEETILRSSNRTVPTELTTLIPDTDSSETKYSSRYKKVPNDLYDRSSEPDQVDGAPPDHVVPYSPHENPEEPSTKPKYTKPGDWAKPSADRDVPLDFVPTKLYAQVRGTHTVKRLPREDALKTAETPEEILAAPRLREVVSKSKTNTIYTEEGYEDAAYDHAGHIRDADFHEGYARKLEDERRNEDAKNAKAKDREEDINREDSDDAEELNDYDDDYSNHAEESSKIEESASKRRNNSENSNKLKNLLNDSDVNPKQIIENGIEKLEEDLNNEYAESERNTEKEVPANLKNPGNDYDNEDDNDDLPSEDDAKDSRDYGRRMSKKIAQSEEASRAMLEDASAEREESRKNEIRSASSSPQDADTSSPQAAEGLKESDDSERLPNESLTTPDYGKLFWDYYKTDASNWNPRETSTANVIATTITESDKSISESLANVPNIASVKSTIGGFDTFAFTPPSTELRGFALGASSSTDHLYPSATSLYESWKRRDRYSNDDESFENESLGSPSNVHLTGSTASDNDPALSLQHDQSATPLVGPKKLTYTVIVRSNGKTTSSSPPSDQEDHSRSEETNFDETPTDPVYPELSNQYQEEIGPETTNDFNALRQDFTVIRPPLPVPLGQVTFADFLPDPYGTLVRPSVTQESEQQLGAQEINGERDGYRLSENSYDYPVHNHVGHALERSRVRHHRGPPLGRIRNHRHPLLTKLVPPSPSSRSIYADYLGVTRNVKPKRSSPAILWPDLFKLYRTIDKTLFGRRRRRSVNEENTKTAASYNRVKVNDNSVDIWREIIPERNFFDEETNRLVAASATTANVTSDDNVRREKSISAEIRKRRSDEDLLKKTPRIVEEVINAEIETRFKDEDEDDTENSEDEDDSSKDERAKIEIEVPEFNFTDVIENNKRQKVISSHPSEVRTLNPKKYPFYGNSEVSQSSALKYITNPREVPRKTLGGTEFYDSRDRYLECADVEPNLEKVLPEDDEPDSDREPQGDQSRLRGLGDKLDCFRAKYFDENPLDNPLFLEKLVGQPGVPAEFDTAKFASRIIDIPNNQAEERITRRISRKPEVPDIRRSGSKVNQVTRQPDRNQQKRFNDDRSSSRKRSGHRRGRDRHEERGQRRRPVQTTTEQPQIAVTPYQREVYEDVMGTIKNLAGMYQTFGESVMTPSIQPTVNHLPVTPGAKDWAYPVVHRKERPRDAMIRGMLPPQTGGTQSLHRHRMFPYRTNKVSYTTRPRTDTPPGSEGIKIGYFKTVRVHKRSLDDRPALDLDAEESSVVSVTSKNSMTNASQPPPSEKIVYTIRDRIRHSKPRGDIGRHGKFTNLEVAGTEDVRRREPRYNRIRRKKGPSSTGEPATTSYWEETDEIKSEEPTVATVKKSTDAERTPRQDFHDEPGETYKIQYSTPQRIQAHPRETRRQGHESSNSGDYEEETELDEDTTSKAPNNNYDVRENVEEDVTKAPAISELEKYLESDPPGYSKAFGEETTEPPERYTEEEDKSAENYQKPAKKDDDEEEDDEEERDEQVERPSESYVEEESSPGSEEAEDEPASPGQSESYKNSDDDNDDEEDDEEEKGDSTKDEESARVEDGETEFMRFASRPFSPFESNEDPKYSDLGPRLSKPSFYHPSFSEQTSSKLRSRDSGGKKYSAESDDSSEESEEKKRSRFVFPWNQDEAEEEGVEESQHAGRSIDGYEYPWEKRERLARERRRKQKEREKYEKLFSISDSTEVDEENEEQDASNSDLIRRRVYPWERYDVPSKSSRGARASRIRKIVDNDGMGTEYRPVAKFSSKYKSRRFDLADDEDPIVVSGADPREVRVSIIKSIELGTRERDKSSELDKILNETVAATPRTSTAPAVSPKVPLRRSRNWKLRSTVSTTSTTIRSISTTSKPRIWRVASSSTKKPSRPRTRTTGIVDSELLKSGSQKKEVTADPVGRNVLNSSTIVSSTTASTINRRNMRRRGNSANRSSSTTTTARPLRRRLQKSTQAPSEAEVTTVKPIAMRTTTPTSKTIEHRSSFSKEEIITKTSYPRMNSKDSKNDEKDETNGRSSDKDDSPMTEKSGKESMRVEKVSITTKETPEHIYRKEEIDKDGVKGMFVSIVPNNGTNSLMETKNSAEDTKEMLTRFDSTEDDELHVDEGAGGSFMHDSYLLANLLRQVPPYTNDLTLDENVQEGVNSFEDEGSGSAEMKDDEDKDANVFPTNYVKNPNERLYYYVEERKR